jgi:hypothetical protein
MSKNALPVTVIIRGSVIFNFLPDRTRKGNLACVQPKTILRSTPFFVWFCRYLSHNDSRLVAGGVLKRNLKVAVNDADCTDEHPIAIPVQRHR